MIDLRHQQQPGFCVGLAHPEEHDEGIDKLRKSIIDADTPPRVGRVKRHRLPEMLLNSRVT